jgi:hypothetical protein
VRCKATTNDAKQVLGAKWSRTGAQRFQVLRGVSFLCKCLKLNCGLNQKAYAIKQKFSLSHFYTQVDLGLTQWCIPAREKVKFFAPDAAIAATSAALRCCAVVLLPKRFDYPYKY